jgi:hypothetical protein
MAGIKSLIFVLIAFYLPDCFIYVLLCIDGYDAGFANVYDADNEIRNVEIKEISTIELG